MFGCGPDEVAVRGPNLEDRLPTLDPVMGHRKLAGFRVHQERVHRVPYGDEPPVGHNQSISREALMDQCRFFQRLEDPCEAVFDWKDEAVVDDDSIRDVRVVLLDLQVVHGGDALDRLDRLHEVGAVPNVHGLPAEGDGPRARGRVRRHVFRLHRRRVAQPDPELEELPHEPLVRKGDPRLIHVHMSAVPVRHALEQAGSELGGGLVDPLGQSLRSETPVEFPSEPFAENLAVDAY